MQFAPLLRTWHRALPLVAVLLLAFALAPAAQAAAADRPTNVILFIPDGFGPAHGTMAREFKRTHLKAGDTLTLDGIEVGSIRTHASDSLITDSAASATAYSTGVKTFNGAIGVDDERLPLATVLQAARQRGLATGVVTTTRVTHASPGSFVAHVPSRSMENEIAEQLLQTRPDLAIGGGLRFFLPEDGGGVRPDGRNLVEEARAAGYTVALDRKAFDDVSTLPLLALLADDHLPYEVDRQAGEPTLADLTRKALALLSDHEKGFFVMIEAGRIDHGAHANDIAATLHDVLAFDEAMRVALDFVAQDGNTLLISVADHETGGLTLGRSIDGRSGYAWHPQVVARVKASHGPIMAALRARSGEVATVLQEFTEIDDLSEAETEALTSAADSGGRGLSGVLVEIISRRAAIGWTTGGHTAVDVRLHAAGVGSEQLAGNHDNTFIARIIEQMLDLDLDGLTRQIRAGNQPSP